MTKTFSRKKVKLSVLEYDDKYISLPLFTSSLGLITGFTFIFPFLALVSLPFSIFIIYSIFTGDIDLIDADLKSTGKDSIEEE